MDELWDTSDARLHEASFETIRAFCVEHPSAEVRCFFFDADDPQYGNVSIGIDTTDNNINSVRQLEGFAVDSRNDALVEDDAWKNARFSLRSPRLDLLNADSGDFAFPQYTDVEFPEWEHLAEAGGYPTGDEDDDDYLEANVRLVCWRVAQRLVASDAFAPMKLASPMALGYSLHDEDPTILRFLNW